MFLYPENALQQLEFDKVIAILSNSCQSPIGKELVGEMRIHTHPKYIQTALSQDRKSTRLNSSHRL